MRRIYSSTRRNRQLRLRTLSANQELTSGFLPNSIRLPVSLSLLFLVFPRRVHAKDNFRFRHRACGPGQLRPRDWAIPRAAQAPSVCPPPGEVGPPASDRLLLIHASGLKGKFPNRRRGTAGSAGAGGVLPASDPGLSQL